MSHECPCCGQICMSEDSLGFHLYSRETKDDLLTYLHNRGIELSKSFPKNFIVQQVVAKVTEAPMRMRSRHFGVNMVHRVGGS